MTRARKSRKTLTGTRIFVRRGNYRYESLESIINPKTGVLQKTHHLCTLDDGEFKAREELQKLLGTVSQPKGIGDFGAWIYKFKIDYLAERELKAPKDPVRQKTWKKGTQNIESALSVIADKFADFDVAQVRGFDVAQFLARWKGRRSAQTYKTYLSLFFEWCISMHGLVDVNPAKQISVKPPRKRDVTMSDAQYHAIRDALLVDEDGKKVRNGEMVQCYMDLLYLLFQRGTDIRLMRVDEIKPEGIAIIPTKTENSSGLGVMLPITPDIQRVLNRIKAISKMRSTFVIHTEHGQPYTASGLRSAFKRAAVRARVDGLTLKDIRSKASSDAKKQGYSLDQLQVTLAHTEKATTRGYIRGQELPVSTVAISLPKR